MRRERTLTALCVVVASVAACAALLTDTTRYFVPFLSAMVFSYLAALDMAAPDMAERS